MRATINTIITAYQDIRGMEARHMHQGCARDMQEHMMHAVYKGHMCAALRHTLQSLGTHSHVCMHSLPMGACGAKLACTHAAQA